MYSNTENEEAPERLKWWVYRYGMSRARVLPFLAALLLVGTVVFLVALRNDAIESSRSSKCRSNLELIGLALQNYRDGHGSFPPAYLCDKKGEAVNSWRLLVADLALYHRNVSRGYDVTQSPKSQRNSQFRLADQTVEEFQCPSARIEKPAITSYVAVVGLNTMWSGCEPTTPAADGSDNDKILLIEVINSDICWFESRDLTLEQALDAIQPKSGIGIGSRHTDGIHYLTVGGEVRTLDPNVSRGLLRKLLTRDLPKECKRVSGPDRRAPLASASAFE